MSTRYTTIKFPNNAFIRNTPDSKDDFVLYLSKNMPSLRKNHSAEDGVIVDIDNHNNRDLRFHLNTNDKKYIDCMITYHKPSCYEKCLCKLSDELVNKITNIINSYLNFVHFTKVELVKTYFISLPNPFDANERQNIQSSVRLQAYDNKSPIYTIDCYYSNPNEEQSSLKESFSWEGGFELPISTQLELFYPDICSEIRNHSKTRQLRFVHNENKVVGLSFKDNIISWTQEEVDELLKLITEVIKNKK